MSAPLLLSGLAPCGRATVVWLEAGRGWVLGADDAGARYWAPLADESGVGGRVLTALEAELVRAMHGRPT